jgi:hypothetical protein
MPGEKLVSQKYPFIHMSKLLFRCEEATRKLIEAEEKKLPLADRLRLGWHLIVCKWCRLFQKQNATLNQSLHELRQSSPQESVKLSEEMKTKMQSALDKRRGEK